VLGEVDEECEQIEIIAIIIISSGHQFGDSNNDKVEKARVFDEGFSFPIELVALLVGEGYFWGDGDEIKWYYLFYIVFSFSFEGGPDKKEFREVGYRTPGVLGAENGTLIISRVTEDHEAHYVCLANNGVGPGLSKLIRLTVNGKWGLIVTFPEQEYLPGCSRNKVHSSTFSIIVESVLFSIVKNT
jgi:hypothetical protein